MLRPYQAELVDAVVSALGQHGSVVLQLPTGGGKTRIAVELAGRAISGGKRVWFLCHRREILNQTSRSFAEAGVAHGIIASGLEWDRSAEVHVCSIGTLARRADTGAPPDLIVWDECHHIAARSWAAVRSRFPDAQHLGLSATPVRLDGKGLQPWFANLACGPSTRTLIEAGYLSTYRLFAPSIPDLRGVGSRGGDYEKGALGRAMDKPTLVGDAIEHYKRHAPGGRAIVFASSVAASEAIVERFCAAGIAAAHVGAKTPETAREEAITALADGRIQVLSNVELFTEGFDLPAIDVVILLRPTRSLALYHQMIGRGLRTAAWKNGTIVLDHAGLVHEHGLPDDEVEWSLTGYRLSPETGSASQPRLRRCPECSAIHPWAAACVECGRVYEPADRTVAEVYGELQEYGRFSTPHYENQAAFARRVGCHVLTVRAYMLRGMPANAAGLIQIEAAEDWVRTWRTRNDAPSEEYESFVKFAERVGMYSQQIKALLPKGLPTDESGRFVNIERGNAWLHEYRIIQSLWRSDPPIGFETKRQFARRVGYKSLSSLVRRGLPCHKSLVPVTEALAWMRSLKAVAPGTERKSCFGRRIGKSESMLSLLVARGLPVRSDGSIDIEEGLSWYHEYESSRRTGINRKLTEGHETQAQFARRTGYSPASVGALIRKGLPCSPDRTIPIELGLLWLEEFKRTHPNPVKRRGPGWGGRPV